MRRLRVTRASWSKFSSVAIASLLLTSRDIAAVSSSDTHDQSTSPAAMVRALTLAHDEENDSAVAADFRRRFAGDRPSLALIEATLHRLGYRYDKALEQYAIARTDSSRATGANALVGQIAVHASKGELIRAQRGLDTLLNMLERLGDHAGMAEAHLTQASIALRTVGADRSAAYIRLARAAWATPESWWDTRATCAELQVAVRRGDAVSDSVWAAVLPRARSAGPRLHAECLFVRLQHIERSGRALLAIPTADTLVQVQRGARLWPALSATLQWRAQMRTSRGLYKTAREDLDLARHYADVGASPGGAAWAVHENGRIAQRLGFVDEAREHFGRARKLFTAISDKAGIAMADRALAETALRAGELTAADSAFAAHHALHDAVVPGNLLPALLARGDIARRQGRMRDAERLLDSATGLVTSRNLPGWMAEIRYQRGLWYMTAGNHESARLQWDSLVRVNRVFGGPARFEIMSRRAESFARAGAFDSAWLNVRQAQREYDQWRSSKTNRTDRLAAVQDRYLDWDSDLGLASSASMFANAGRIAEAFALAEWRRLRTVEQQSLQRGALSIRSSDVASTSVAVIVGADSNSLDVRRFPALARARLSAKEAVVAFITGEGGEPSTAFVLTSDTLRVVPLPPIDSLLVPIARFTAFVAAGRVPESLARDLSHKILHPVLAAVPGGITEIRFVLDGALHRLPIAALPLSDGQPLLTRYRLALSPTVEDALGGATMVVRSARGERRALVVGAPAVMPVAPGGVAPWAALPGARREATQVASRLRGAERIDGTAATPATVLAKARTGGSIWHVATHAVADPGRTDGSAIVLQSDGSGSGMLSSTDLSAGPIPFDLAVLSACASAEGAFLAGQPLHGLVSTLLDQGVRGVVATRWRVDDDAMVDFIARFYDGVTSSGDVVGALHSARLDALSRGLSPALWAGIEFYGDPSLRMTPAPPASWWSRTTHSIRNWLTGRGNGPK